MPPRKSRRHLDIPPDEEVASDPDPQNAVQDPSNGNLNDTVRLAQLPPELFDAIIENYRTLPLTFYNDTHDRRVDAKYYERNDALTALSQTCRALRVVALPRLWARLDICRVPERAHATWYKYTMLAIERKAKGIVDSPVRHHVRTLTLLFSKSKPEAALAALWEMLSKLPNLRTIQVITCKTPGFAKSLTDSKLTLPNVTTLYIPDSVSVFQRICPNATHIHCAGGNGAALLSSLTDKTEHLSGMMDWTNPRLTERLLKKAPNIKKVELRRPVNWGMGIESQNSVPLEWSKVIPKLAALKQLRELILTFPSAENQPYDATLIESARTMMRERSTVEGEQRLVLRHIVARHYSRPEQAEDDVMTSCRVECFE